MSISRVAISVWIDGEQSGDRAVEFVDAFNEWARHPDVDALMAHYHDDSTGGLEADYRVDILAPKEEVDAAIESILEEGQ